MISGTVIVRPFVNSHLTTRSRPGCQSYIDNKVCYGSHMLMEELGSSLRCLREERGWSLEQLARKLDTTRQALSLIEKGKVSPPIDKLSKIAEAVGAKLYVQIKLDQGEPMWLAPILRELIDVSCNLYEADIRRLIRIARAMSKIDDDEGKDLALRSLEREAERQQGRAQAG